MNYPDLITALSELNQSAQTGAIKSVNRFLVLRNWLYGAYLVEYEQQGEDRAAYGTGLLDQIAKDLRARGVKGLGVSILRLTRRFFELYPQIRQSVLAECRAIAELPIRQSLITELDPLEKWQSVTGKSGQSLPSLLPASKVLEFSWTHLIELIRLDHSGW